MLTEFDGVGKTVFAGEKSEMDDVALGRTAKAKISRRNEIRSSSQTWSGSEGASDIELFGPPLCYL